MMFIKSTVFIIPSSSHSSPGIRPAIQRRHNQDGREQPGHGDGSQLSPVPLGRPADHLREHAQGDVLPADAHRSPGHRLH